MIKAKFSTLAAAAVLALGTIGTASALTLTAGNYKITFDNYDSGTLYGNTPGVLCNTVATCDTYAAANGLPASGSIGSVNTSADTMGILSVLAIQNIQTGAVEYLKGTASSIGGVTVGPYLTGVFGNLNDQAVEVTCGIASCSTTALATGGGFKIFSNTSDWDPTLGSTGGGDLGAYQYAPSISGGSLFLEGDFVAGVLGAGAFSATTTYLTQYNNAGVAGNGSGYINFTGGAAKTFFDTNSLTTTIGTKADAFLTVTFDNASGNLPADWLVKSSGQVTGALIPEPGSLALVALAMLGLGAASRRRA